MSESEQPEQPYLNSMAYRYHVLTKHSLQSLYSKSGSLDWALQPDPFRVYAGAEKIALPPEMFGHSLDLFQLIRRFLDGQTTSRGQTPATVPTAESESDSDLDSDLNSDSGADADAGALVESEETDIKVPPPVVAANLSFVSSLLYHSMAISAWKQIRGTDHKWALRVNPSSGNLHPSETHLLIGSFDGIDAGAYHYSVKDHKLERRSISNGLIDEIWSVLDLPQNTAPPMMLVLTSIFWREAWKYNDRAFRYCQLDLGHAYAAIGLAAAGFGWQTLAITEFPDREIASCLGLKDSDEQAMILIPLYPPYNSIDEFKTASNDTNEISDQKNTSVQSEVGKSFSGIANALSIRERQYQSIKDVQESTILDAEEFRSRNNLLKNFSSSSSIGTENGERIAVQSLSYQPANNIVALEVIRKRRSAVEMDGKLRISLARMVRILVDSTRGFDSSFSECLPFEATESTIPFFIHIILYVHRVDGIAPGAYYFDRRSLELICLSEANIRTHTKFVSCMQDIAADGVFAVSLVADMDAAFKCFGDRGYRYIHQEAGYIGHLFYLTARALDIDATGIGCFLDDEINKSLPTGMETVYNFTFGKGLEDSRLSEISSYDFEPIYVI